MAHRAAGLSRTRGGANVTAPIAAPDVRTDESTALDHPWKVIVWDDPINLMSYVTFVFRKVFGYSEEKAHRLMMEVHVEGRSVVASGSREKAELDVFRLHEHGLWATMEQDS